MNKVSKLLFVIVILNFVLIEQAFAQGKADTLRAVLPYAHGMSRADILNELSWEIKASDPENSFILAQEALELSEKINYNRGMAYAYKNLAINGFLTANFKRGLTDAYTGLYYARKTDDLFVQGKLLNAAGIILKETQQYAESYNLYVKALNIFLELSNWTEIAGMLNNIGLIYSELGDRDKELIVYMLVVSIEKKQGNMFGLARTYNNMGILYASMDKHDEALGYYKKAYNILDSLQDTYYKAACLHGIASIYAEKDSLDMAVKYYQEAMEINGKYGFNQYYANNLFNLSELHFQMGMKDLAYKELDQAIDMYKTDGETYSYLTALFKKGRYCLLENDLSGAKALADQCYETAVENHYIDIQHNAAHLYYNINKKLGNHVASLTWLEEYMNLSDKLNTAEKDKLLYQLEIQLAIDKNQKENIRLKTEAKLAKKTINNQWMLIAFNSLIGFLVIVLLIVVVISNNRKKRNNLLLLLKNQEISKQAEQLKELNTTKDKFFSIVSHDLKNPLSAITNASELLFIDFDTLSVEERTLIIKSIKEQSDSILSLLDNLLNWAYSNLGKMTFNPVDFNILELLNRTNALTSFIANQKNISVETHIETDRMVHADKNMIQSVLLNLVTNAIKFTRPGGNINIYVREHDQNVVVTVSDTGLGMSPEKLKNLFELDNNKSTRGTANESGVGLGLHLCHEFLKKHGKQMTIKSTPGIGSEFSFSLNTNR